MSNAEDSENTLTPIQAMKELHTPRFISKAQDDFEHGHPNQLPSGLAIQRKLDFSSENVSTDEYRDAPPKERYLQRIDPSMDRMGQLERANQVLREENEVLKKFSANKPNSTLDMQFASEGAHMNAEIRNLNQLLESKDQKIKILEQEVSNLLLLNNEKLREACQKKSTPAKTQGKA